MKISIVLPTYNEKENIAILIPQIEKLFSDKNTENFDNLKGYSKSSIEIIVVDDNSPDVLQNFFPSTISCSNNFRK